MADNVYSLLAGWLRYQRDIGVDGLVFGHGSALGEILAGGGRSGPYKGAPADGGDAAVVSRRAKAGEKPPAVGASAGSKLAARMKPIDELDPGMLERKRPPAPAQAAPVNSARRERLAGLYREVIGCEKCPMSSSRAKLVFGAGSADGRLFVLADAPSAADDVAGLPFQGEAGALLDSILGKMKVDRKSGIFATYLQKCKSADAEFIRGCAEVCRSILDRQISIIEPKAVLVFGESAAGVLLGDDRGEIERMRMGDHSYMGVPVVATYGLQLMIKDTSLRRGAWRDIEKVLSIIR
ncbi:MAG: uracil-DNA glycosylase [Chitinispirillales bacterium]|jgi:DNA polymerase|nr:uracil-DNA glycosylase [Chitinispirillales bacterium]